MGFYDKVEDFFSIFNVFVMSSDEEGLGSSVLDAFLYKVPVVSTDAGGLKDLLRDNRGIMCAKKHPEQLSQAINQVLNDKELADALVSNAYSYATAYHSMQYITQQYLEAFQ